MQSFIRPFRQVWYFIQSLASAIWFALSEGLYELLLLGFVIYLLFERWQGIVDFHVVHSESSLWSAIVNDIYVNPNLYYIFIVALLLWVVIKYAKLRRDKKQSDEFLNKITELITEIRKDRNERNERRNRSEW
jgi:hypothetical protein